VRSMVTGPFAFTAIATEDIPLSPRHIGGGGEYCRAQHCYVTVVSP